MNKQAIIVFVCLVSVVICSVPTTLWISQQSYSLNPVGQQWQAFTPVIYGGSGKYLIKYDDIPAHWDDYHGTQLAVTDNVLLIPKNVEGRFQVKVEVYDLRYKSSITKYLILQFEYGYLRVFVRDSFDKFVNYDKYYKYEGKDIVEYPSWSRVQFLIQEGDIVELQNIINRIIKSDNDCDDNKAFFNGVSSRIDKFLSQSDHKIHEAKAEIEAVQDEIELKKRLVADLLKVISQNKDVDKLKWSLISAQEDLEWYLKKNEFTIRDILDFARGIQENNKVIWEIRNKVIPSLKKQIASLESQLTGMNDPRWWSTDPRWDWKIKETKDLLNKKKWILEQADLNAKALEAKNDWYQKRIVYLKRIIQNDTPQIDELKARIAELELQIKGKLQGQEGIDALNREIEKLESLIKYYEHLIEITKDAQWKVKQALPKLSVLFGSSVYQCKHVSVQDYKYDAGSSRGYLAWDEFDHYFNREYGQYGKVPAMEKKSVVEVSLSDYYSAWWKNDYQEDPFTCKDLEREKSYWGTVKRRGGNSIWVNYDSDQYELSFASCSYLEVVSRDISVGSKIVWKGTKTNLGRKFNVRQAICY